MLPVLRSRHFAWGAAVLLLVPAMGIGAVSYVAADKLIHPPREHVDATPATRGIAYEPVAFASEDGIPLAGWWVPAEAARGTVVFLHGYGASKAQSLAVIPFLHAAGLNVFAFDFRAHGDSGGSYTTVGLDETQDVRAAVAWVSARADAGGIALFGWSMGGATALHAAGDLPQVRAIVTDSSFSALSHVVGRNLGRWTGLPEFPFSDTTIAFAAAMTGRDVRDNEPAKRAEHIARPLLVIQGLDDDIALESDGEEIARGAGERATLWLVPSAGHVSARAVAPDEYERHVVSFLLNALR